MFKVKVITIGKIKESWLIDALEDYEKRLKPHLLLEWHLCKTDAELTLKLQKENHYIALDPQGKQFSSEAFSTFLQKELEKQGSRLTFCIGGADGLTSEMKKNASALISLSSLTFTHQLTRLILAEQLYRACEIQKGTPYHK